MNVFLAYYIYVNIWNIVSIVFRRYWLWGIRSLKKCKIIMFGAGYEVNHKGEKIEEDRRYLVEDPLS